MPNKQQKKLIKSLDLEGHNIFHTDVAKIKFNIIKISGQENFLGWKNSKYSVYICIFYTVTIDIWLVSNITFNIHNVTPS